MRRKRSDDRGQNDNRSALACHAIFRNADVQLVVSSVQTELVRGRSGHQGAQRRRAQLLPAEIRFWRLTDDGSDLLPPLCGAAVLI